MKRVKLTVAYDGTGYSGWQVQPNGPTIEGELNTALSELLGEEIVVTGASRTDAGVHSLGNVAIFDTEARIPAEKISYAVNKKLPEAIVVIDSCEVEADWHPRHCDSIKTYEYRILSREFPDPTRRLNTYFTYLKFDEEKMAEAAEVLVGTHDFKSYCSANTAVTDFVRTIYSCQVIREDDLITIRVTGNGFLYNMVRIIAGTLMEVGCGRRSIEEVKKSLELCDRSSAGPTAPAAGLTMIGIKYL